MGKPLVPDFSDDEKVKQYIHDRRVIGYDPLLAPSFLLHKLPTSPESLRTTALARYRASQIIQGQSSDLLVIVGPCSIHSPAQALHYARLLKTQLDAGRFPRLLILMRTYFEKPRTTIGWKGLINDPNIDGSFAINDGLQTARKLLHDITSMGIPVASELLDTISPQYISDLLSWGAIGARTTESQLHRELASGVSFPIGFKNGTDGSVSTAIDAMSSSSHPHAFMGVTTTGLASIVKTRGNDDVHIILRGGSSGPNFSSEHIQDAFEKIQKSGTRKFPSIMVDCSHGNSQKNHLNQPKVISSLCKTLTSPSSPEASPSLPHHVRHITGVMIESNIREGKQSIPSSYSATRDSLLKYGVSITDACVDWDMTMTMLDELNEVISPLSSVFLLMLMDLSNRL
ncbi:hypothetical protein PLEOSDRAFT_1048814 [Pleurotus ostreatus PC15]|uniref:Phospho-2-dehydro-3-deoxyheptonate aldolase n=1 Tax=Pleurotus ostreatus (strain PC15) TaxID=1137138 RepID=A0A067N889_PLEO1|nr:hypothetical protein PLEOSDRAFT_1048814 [Pleurotus ostreatus PC15]